MDKLGRKFIQILGFLGMALCYLIISLTSFGGYELIPAIMVLVIISFLMRYNIYNKIYPELI